MSSQASKDPPIVESVSLQRIDGTLIPTTYLVVPMAYDQYRQLKILANRYGTCPEMIAGMMMRRGIEQYISQHGLRSEDDRGSTNNQPGG